MQRFAGLAAFVAAALGAASAHATVTLTEFGIAPSPAASTNVFSSLGTQGVGLDAAAVAVWPATVDFALLATLPPSLVLRPGNNGT